MLLLKIYVIGSQNSRKEKQAEVRLTSSGPDVVTHHCPLEVSCLVCNPKV